MTEITSFGVETNFKPNSISIEWSISGALEANEHVIIRRALTTYPKTPDDGTLILDTDLSSTLSHEDNNLESNRYFYYSIFVKNISTGDFTELTSKINGFALAYQDWDSADDLYNLFPEETKSYDEQTTGDLKRLCDVMGNVIDLYRSEIFVTEYNRKPDKAPDNLLDFFSESFGFPAERSVDLNTLRRIGEGIVSIYKNKGTAKSIRNFIKLFTEWDNQVLQAASTNFQLWNQSAELERGTLTSTGFTFATDTTKSWDIDQWARGVFSDQDGDTRYTITSNNSDTLQLDIQPPAVVSDSGTLGGGFDNGFIQAASNISAVTGTAQTGLFNSLTDLALNTYPDNYWNGSYCIITSGANIGKRSIVRSFDSDAGILVFEIAFPNPVSVGDTYQLERFLHIRLPITGYSLNELSGRRLSITAGTNSGSSAKIARNYEFGGNTELVLSTPFTLVTDSTSTVDLDQDGLLFQDTTQTWTVDEWRNYKLTVDSVDYNIVSNTVDTLKLSPVYSNQGSPSAYKFFDFFVNYPTQTNSYTIENQYYVTNGYHAFLFTDLLDPTFRGTLRDTAKFLFGGETRSIVTTEGSGPFDLPIVIFNAIEVFGRSSNLTATTLTGNVTMVPNEFVGFKLNPNDQQTVDFLIVSNTTNTITVTGNLSLTAVAQIGNNFYIISKENSIKLQRLNGVIKEFVPHYLRPVIFHEIN